jgi:tetratricopeptide (TPR) repeat protein
MLRQITIAFVLGGWMCAQTLTALHTTDQQIATYESALGTQPKNVRSQLSLALAYLQKVRETADYSYLDRASALVGKVLAGDSGNNQALRLRNEIGLQKHEFRDVADSAADLSKLAPNDAGNWANLGDALMELGQYDRAGAAYARMIQIRPGLESYNRAAYHKYVTGDSETAIRLMKTAIAAGSSTPEPIAWCYAELGDMYFKTGNVGEALDAYSAAVKLFPSLHRAHAGLGRVFAGQGKGAAAIESYKRAQAAVPLPEYAAALEKLYSRGGNAVEARKQRALIDVMDRLASSRGEKANRVLALIYLDEGRNIERAAQLAEAELDNRGDVYTYDALGWVYFKQNRIAEAESMSARAVKLKTPEPSFYYHAGIIAAAAGRVEDARNLLTRALDLNAQFDSDAAAAARNTIASLPN